MRLTRKNGTNYIVNTVRQAIGLGPYRKARPYVLFRNNVRILYVRHGKNNVRVGLHALSPVTENSDCRRIRQQSPFSATVGFFGDKVSPKSATIVSSACGQAVTRTIKMQLFSRMTHPVLTFVQICPFYYA